MHASQPLLLVRRTLAVTAVLAVVLSGAFAVSAAAQDPDGTDALMASLLQTEDLPAGFATLGPEEGSPFDIDSGAFTRFGGRRVVSQTWSSETSGVVFDFRMELPSPEAAADYLEEAEPTLSEADATGLDLETDEPAVGEDARHFHGVTRVSEDQAIAFDNYLFRVGPVAAKVFVAAVDLPAGEARRLAEAAAERMTVFGLPVQAEAAPPTVVPSLPAVGRLAAKVPADIAASCRPFESGIAGEIGALSCQQDDTLIVYSAVATADALSDAFATATAEMPEAGLDVSCAEGPYSGAYAIDGVRGRIACWVPPGGGLVLFWTDDDDLVLGAILAESDEHERLDRVWRRVQLR